jgi:hypothetical protein
LSKTSPHVIRPQNLKLIGIPLAGALIIYFAGYFGIEHLRHRKGPWTVEFLAIDGAPAIRVTQPYLGISNVVIRLEGETVPPSFTNQVMTFSEPRDTPFPVPHGRVIFEDLTFLPGTVTFDLEGHGVELVPRTLVYKRQEHTWQSDQTIGLKPEDKTHPITPAEYEQRVKGLKKQAR